MRPQYFLLLSWIFLIVACDTQAVKPTGQGQVKWKKFILDNQAYGPAFTTVRDMDEDGKLDLVVTQFGPVANAIETQGLPLGKIAIYYQRDNVKVWEKRVILKDDPAVIFPQASEVVDVDRDGDLDLLCGSGFLACHFIPDVKNCGAVFWLENDQGNWIKRELISNQSLFYHKILSIDLDMDGLLDLLTVAEDKRIENQQVVSVAQLQLFKGVMGDLLFETTPVILAEGLGSLPELFDLDGDGDLDLISAEYFAPFHGSVAWLEQQQNGADLTWERHVISDQLGPSIQGSLVKGLLGGMELGLLLSNHTNPQVNPNEPEAGIFYLTPSANPKEPWVARKLSKGIKASTQEAGQAAPGVFDFGDADGDGDIDLFVSGDADHRLFLIEQRDQQFYTHVFDRNIAQAGGTKIVDLDQDQRMELIANHFEGNELILYLRADDGAYPLEELGIADPIMPPPALERSDVSIKVNGVPNAKALVTRLYDSQKQLIAEQRIEQATNPQSLEFKELLNGRYDLLMYIDENPISVDQAGSEDISIQSQLFLPALGEISLDFQVKERAAGQLNVKVNGELSLTHKLIVALYDQLPPTGPPLFFENILPTAQPQLISFRDLPGGEYWIYAFSDLEPINAYFPDPTDPQFQSTQGLVIDGNIVDTDIELQIPALP